VEKYCREGQATDDNMAHAHYMLDNSGFRHLEYVIIIALPMQQWLQENASMLRYTCIACLVTEMELVYCAVRTQSYITIQGYFII